MPNILLTQKCIRSCPYCFARKHMHDSPPDDILKWEDLIYIVDFFHIIPPSSRRGSYKILYFIYYQSWASCHGIHKWSCKRKNHD